MSKKSRATDTATPEPPSQTLLTPIELPPPKFIHWQINIGGIDVYIELTPMNILPHKGALVLVFVPPAADSFDFLDWQQLWFVEDGSWHARTSDNKMIDQGIIDTVRVSNAVGWCYLPMTSTRWCINQNELLGKRWVEPA